MPNNRKIKKNRGSKIRRFKSMRAYLRNAHDAIPIFPKQCTIITTESILEAMKALQQIPNTKGRSTFSTMLNNVERR